jgi:stress-induced morphogen
LERPDGREVERSRREAGLPPLLPGLPPLLAGLPTTCPLLATSPAGVEGSAGLVPNVESDVAEEVPSGLEARPSPESVPVVGQEVVQEMPDVGDAPMEEEVAAVMEGVEEEELTARLEPLEVALVTDFIAEQAVLEEALASRGFEELVAAETMQVENMEEAAPSTEVSDGNVAYEEEVGTFEIKLEGGESAGKRFQCVECGKELSTKNGLDYHMRTHTGYSPFQCELCLKRFKSSSLCSRHRQIHNTDKKYSCEVCSKSFAQKSNLSKHMDIHAGIKPFQVHRILKVLN